LQGRIRNMTTIADFHIEGSFPVIITPQQGKLSLADFKSQLMQQKEALQALLLKHGALMFRGFPLTNAADFASVIQTLSLGHFVNYIGGDSPRDKVEENIYTSTEAPPHFHIPLHQELSFIKYFPHHIYFFCQTAAVKGGATIIGDAREILNMLDPMIKQKFQTQQLKYTAHYYRHSRFMRLLNRFQRSHKSWTEVFETRDKTDVEKKCLLNEFNFRWLPRDWLEISQLRPAIMPHPQTNEVVWFNQAHLYDFNPKLLGWKNYIGAKMVYARKSTRLHEVSFGDGERIPRKDLYHIMDVLHEKTVNLPWEKGDMMVLDNVLAMHGRAPFKGKRRVLTAMTTHK
jgi:alpha-ketoglutarate-dependent taurine dioxygenase